VNNKGVVGVLIVERKPGAGDRCLEQLFAASFDGGATFTSPQQISHSACGSSPVDVGAARLFPTYGDYYGIVTSPDGVFRVLWPEMRDGHSVLLTTFINVTPD
jgi:hypothetical protein